MRYPIKVCAICSEEFELKPDKPGFATHCPDCTAEEEEKKASATGSVDADERRAESEMNEERRKAIRDLLYRKDS